MGISPDVIEAAKKATRYAEFSSFMQWVISDLTREDAQSIYHAYQVPGDLKPTADDQPTLGIAWEGWAARAGVEPYDD